jgi:CRP-like cAMP-binding protein
MIGAADRPLHLWSDPAIQRLIRLGPLDDQAFAALRAAMTRTYRLKPRRDIIHEGREITEPLLILEGWGARVRFLPDGRRQVLGFLLPGDLIGCGRNERPLATAMATALTPMQIAPAPLPAPGSALEKVYAASRALDDVYLLAQITRLGRMHAWERIGDLLLEFRERLSLAGLAGANGFPVPVTQEVLADALGLTPVHVNRTLQLLRRQGDITWKGDHVTLGDPTTLAMQLGHVPAHPATRP